MKTYIQEINLMNLPSRDSKKKETTHWTDGGTAITNFNPRELKFWIAAVKEHLDKDFYIDSMPHARSLNKLTTPCLHHRNMFKDTTAFFQVLDRIREECI